MPDSQSRLLPFIQIAIVLCAIGAVFVVLFPRRAIDESATVSSFSVAGWLNGTPPQDLDGKVVLIDVWAWWCGPCMADMPDMVALHEQFASEDVVFIGLTPDGPTELPNIQAVLDAHPGMTWPIGYGAEPTLERLGWDRAVPTYILIDRTGKIAWSGHWRVELENRLVRMLAQ